MVEIAPQNAFEHLVESSARGAEKRDFPSPCAEEGAGPIGYPWSSRLKFAARSLLPTSLVRARRRRTASLPHPREPLGDEILAKLLCPICRVEAARIARVPGVDELACGNCGTRYRSREGVFDFDRAV